jgi:hypothetical protein
MKMRCVENHDQLRIMRRAPNRAQALAWTAFQAFNEGAFLIYAGQESESTHTPSLFDLDKILWRDYSLQGYLARLCHLKKDPVQVNGKFGLLTAEPLLTAAWQAAEGGLYGAFNVIGSDGVMATPLQDGTYVDLLSDQLLSVRDGQMALPESAVILRFDGQIETQWREPFDRFSGF